MLRATYTCALFGWKIEKAQTMGKMSTYWGLSREPTSPAHHPHQQDATTYVQIDFDINIFKFFFHDNFPKPKVL